MAFALSGAAGLAYEVLWTRYLGLFVGHAAYAQVLVLAVYLGGMALGSLAVADLSRRLARPLLWYSSTEAALAVAGLSFDAVYRAATGLAYDALFSALPSAAWVGAVRWGVAGLLILPQAALLGATFPLMAAALVRRQRAFPGRGVADAYLANTLGGAGGVLLAGFVWIAQYGLPGAGAWAAAFNAAAAGLALLVVRREASERPSVSAALGEPGDGGARVARPDGEDRALAGTRPAGTDLTGLARTLLAVSFGTAIASFAYEIGWIRMLALVLGGATHAFELMLSAFVLGLALGARLVRDPADAAPDPVRLLGAVQVAMGLAALATLPLYTATFHPVAAMVGGLQGRPFGYELFNVGRYGIALAVMLPATTLAGATLPLLIATLLRAGAGEDAIGRIYAANTVGAVAGAGLAGLVALPALGLEGLLLAGAGLDVALGIFLLARAARAAGRGPILPAGAALVSALALSGVAAGVRLDPILLTSGAFRDGRIPAPGERRALYYRDGRTATVSAHLSIPDGLVVLSTNGKADASLGPRWLRPPPDTAAPRPIEAGRDFTTQVLAPMVGLAHIPRARTVANVGHGSGMSATSLLSSPRLERVVTIEIEPAMVEGSFVFLPANARAFDDPRSTFVFDDAKSFFAARKERFDLVFAEPSNPWVSGTASLFTVEFYRRVRDYLSGTGVLTQWMQIYELDDGLFLSMLAALDAAFPSYRGYLVGDGDVAVVAAARPLPEPDWSVLDLAAFRRLTPGAPPFLPEHLDALRIFDETTFRAVLDRGVRANSDLHPVLDAGAERARFRRDFAEGLYSFVANRLDLEAAWEGRRKPPRAHRPVPALGLDPLVYHGRAAWMRDAFAAGGGAPPAAFTEWSSNLIDAKDLILEARTRDGPRGTWPAWAAAFERTERELHWGTSGWADEPFYAAVWDFLARADAPAEARAVVDLTYGWSAWDWERAAGAAELLVAPVALGGEWIRPTVLLDAAVVAFLRTGRPAAARRAFELLARRSGRAPWNLRNRLLDAWIREAEEGG